MKVWCQLCQKNQNLFITESFIDPSKGHYIDLLCSNCKLILATIEVPELGEYEFRLVDKK